MNKAWEGKINRVLCADEQSYQDLSYNIEQLEERYGFDITDSSLTEKIKSHMRNGGSPRFMENNPSWEVSLMRDEVITHMPVNQYELGQRMLDKEQSDSLKEVGVVSYIDSSFRGSINGYSFTSEELWRSMLHTLEYIPIFYGIKDLRSYELIHELMPFAEMNKRYWGEIIDNDTFSYAFEVEFLGDTEGKLSIKSKDDLLMKLKSVNKENAQLRYWDTIQGVHCFTSAEYDDIMELLVCMEDYFDTVIDSTDIIRELRDWYRQTTELYPSDEMTCCERRKLFMGQNNSEELKQLTMKRDDKERKMKA